MRNTGQDTDRRCWQPPPIRVSDHLALAEGPPQALATPQPRLPPRCQPASLDLPRVVCTPLPGPRGRACRAEGSWSLSPPRLGGAGGGERAPLYLELAVRASLRMLVQSSLQQGDACLQGEDSQGEGLRREATQTCPHPTMSKQIQGRMSPILFSLFHPAEANI